jgi:hypothetical protein
VTTESHWVWRVSLVLDLWSWIFGQRWVRVRSLVKGSSDDDEGFCRDAGRGSQLIDFDKFNIKLIICMEEDVSSLIDL